LEVRLIDDVFRTLASDPTTIDRWSTGLNDYWPKIQVGLTDLPVEINALSERMNEQCKRSDEVISDPLDMLVELLQGYKVEKQRNFFIYNQFLFRIYVNDLKKHCKMNKKLFKKLIINKDVQQQQPLIHHQK